jgi:hypothetical protein
MNLTNVDNHLPDTLKSLTTEELMQELSRSLEITARHLLTLASIWRELESRGVDLSDLRRGLLAFVPMIANNRILPEVVVNYAGNKTLLNALSKCSLDEQRDLIATNRILLIEAKEGEYSHLEVNLNSISTHEIYQVFGETGVRTEREQIKLIEREPSRKKKVIPRKMRRIEVDGDHNVLLVGSAAGDLDRVISALSRHYGVDLNEFLKKSAS